MTFANVFCFLETSGAFWYHCHFQNHAMQPMHKLLCFAALMHTICTVGMGRREAGSSWSVPVINVKGELVQGTAVAITSKLGCM